ncbi:pyridoxal-phosphate dependent enzyme [soil metagenome]
MLRQSLPWLPLGSYPTAVEEIRVDGRCVLVKRDDRCAPGYAGNKVRKLEFLLGAARAAGTRRLITAGATGSHHAFATAYHGRALGFASSLVLFPQRLTAHVRELLLLDHAVGAELRWVRRMEAVPFGMWRARVAHRRDRPAVIPPGGSSATGSLGYVNAGLELAGQIDDGSAPRPDRIHVAAGTLGTAAGLAVGLAWAGLPIPVIASRITSRLVASERALQALVRRIVELLASAGADPPDAAAALRLLDLRHDQFGDGYGRATEQGARAADLFGAAGLSLDGTYTAKAAAGLLADQTEGLPLFWHTLSAVAPLDLLEDGRNAALPQPFADYLAAADSVALPDA